MSDRSELAQVIRIADGNHSLGAGALADRIMEPLDSVEAWTREGRDGR